MPERDENQGNGIHCDPDTASGTEQFIIPTTLNSAGKSLIIGHQWETPFCIWKQPESMLGFLDSSVHPKEEQNSINQIYNSTDWRPTQGVPCLLHRGCWDSLQANGNPEMDKQMKMGVWMVIQLYRPTLECQNYKGKPSRSYPAFHSHANCALQLFLLSCI